MSAIPNVTGLSVSYDAYIRHGWSIVPIPPNTKGPQHKGWNKKENCLQLGTQLPNDFGVGLAHAYSGTMALDIDDLDSARQLLGQHNIYLDLMLSAPDAVTIESGNPGHHKLIYAMPFGLTLPSKKIKHDGKTSYELRCATAEGLTVQDVLPPSRHPRGTTYQWGGHGNWQRLPAIPNELLLLWQSLITSDQTKNIKVDNVSDASIDEIRSALYAINPSCDRQTWIECGMALHSTDHPQAFDLWNEWSSSSAEKYDARDMPIQWRSFKDHRDGISIGTLFHHAQEAGWKRPMPDVAHLFSEITPENPNQVIDLLTLRLQPPEVDLSLFPELLSRRATEVSITRGCDPVVPLMAGLGAVCAAVDARSRLELLPGYTVPPILWLMTIGDPSDKKSPGAKPMLSVLQRLEVEDIDRFKVEHLMWGAKEAAYATAKKALYDHMQSADALLDNTAIPAVPELPPEPKSARLVINDATSQKLVHLAQGRPRGFLLHLDEMGNWINRINDPRSGDDRGCWIAGYESNPYTMDRVTAGTISAENMALAIYGNIQPTIFKQQVAKMSSDGLLQRFIPISIRGDKTVKPKTIPEFMTSEGEYEQLIRTLYAIDAQTYQLSDEAYQLFDEFQDWYLLLRNDERLLKTNGVYMTALGKIEGTCGRLALVFHLCTSPYDRSVSRETMEKAIAVTKTFIVPSLRYAFANEENEFEQWVIDHVIHYAGEKPTVTLSDLRRSARRQIPDGMTPYQIEQDIRVIMDQLAASNWVSIIDERRNGITWAINPHVATLYADYRQSVIRAKQAIKDRMIETVERCGRTYNRPRKVLGAE